MTRVELDRDLMLNKIRTQIVKAKANTGLFEYFQTKLCTRYADLASLIEMAAEVHVDYLCLKAYTSRGTDQRLVQSPIKILYMFLLQFAYIYPSTFFTHDDANGTNISKLRLAIQTEFMPMCINITYPDTTLIDTDMIRVLI